MEYLHAHGYACLTKENFWNSMQVTYPAEMKHFCDWIDEYKKKNQFADLFKTIFDETVKYHDLPLAMQGGIFAQYCKEHSMGLIFEIHGFFKNPALAIGAVFKYMNRTNDLKP